MAVKGKIVITVPEHSYEIPVNLPDWGTYPRCDTLDQAMKVEQGNVEMFGDVFNYIAECNLEPVDLDVSDVKWSVARAEDSMPSI